MDWNWFFSSLSQSAAAIVGIFCAFIVTKILSNQEIFLEKNNQLKNLIVEAERIRDSAEALCIDWYNKHTTTEELKSAQELIESNIALTAEEIYEKLDFSPFLERDVVMSEIDNLIQSEKDRLAKEEAERKRQIEYEENLRQLEMQGGLGSVIASAHRASVLLNSDFSLKPAHSTFQLSPTLQFGHHLTNERQQIELVLRDAKHHVRVISNFLNSVQGNPESSRQITFSLILVTMLFFIGVIYPLSFMPKMSGSTFELSFSAFFPLLFSIKGMLLCAFSIVFVSALTMFFVTNLKMKYSIREVSLLQEFSDISAYSRYFAVMRGNQQAKNKRRS